MLKKPIVWGKKSNLPRPIADHGLLGEKWLMQHMLVDPNWTLEHIGDTYLKLSKALKTYNYWMKVEGQYDRKLLERQVKRFRNERQNGDNLLQSLKLPHTAKLSKLLEKRRDMRRLYTAMPLHKVEKNIDNRTFHMRKELDRLNYKKQLLEARLQDALQQKHSIDIRIRYEDTSKVEDPKELPLYKKNINDMKLRLKAGKTINATYTKMIHILTQDENVYEKILDSLIKDSEDQQHFISCILEIGKPGIQLFNKLHVAHKRRREKYTKKARAMLQDIIACKKNQKSHGIYGAGIKPTAPSMKTHYQRVSENSKVLTNALIDIQSVMTKLKEATTSDNTNIYSTIRNKESINRKYAKQMLCNREAKLSLRNKHKMCLVYKDLLKRNYVQPIPTIEKDLHDLKKEIEAEDKIEEDIMAHMKKTAKLYVLLRYALWSIYDIAKLVNVPVRRKNKIVYPNSHLKLPLLKFDMLTMTACPPNAFEIELEELIIHIKAALKKLVKAFLKLQLNQESIEKCKRIFDEQFTKVNDIDDDDEFMHSNFNDDHGLKDKSNNQDNEDDDDTRAWTAIPNRTKIKERSAKIIDNVKRRTLLEKI